MLCARIAAWLKMSRASEQAESGKGAQTNTCSPPCHTAERCLLIRRLNTASQCLLCVNTLT